MTVSPQYKIIADHLRSSSFLICDGILPGNEGRAYVLRRILRRAMLQLHKLGAKESLMHKFVALLVKEMSGQYPDLKNKQQFIEQTLKDEEDKFRQTLDKGLKILNSEIKQAQANNSNISGVTAFKLYDTYGFPLDLTQDIIKEYKLEVDLSEFDEQMQIQKDRAKKSWHGADGQDFKKLFFDLEQKLGSTSFVGYEQVKHQSQILAIESINEQKFVILKETPFYATSGGQRGDNGHIILANDFEKGQLNNFFKIIETKKQSKNLYIHLVEDEKGSLKVGDKVWAVIDNIKRQTRAQGHSCTHILNKALKVLIDQNISQKGSAIEHDSFTFDFNLNRALTEEEIIKIEDLVNFYIRQNSQTNIKQMALKEALNAGAEAMFDDKYEDKVRVLEIGPSIELCGGTHIEYTGNIGLFKIIAEASIASGIRRITAKVGAYAFEYMRLQERKLNALTQALKINYKDNLEDDQQSLWLKKGYNDATNIDSPTQYNGASFGANSVKDIANLGLELEKSLKDKEKQLANLKKQSQLGQLSNIQSVKVGNIEFVSHIFKDIEAKDLRQITNDFKSKDNHQQNHIIILFSTVADKVFTCIAVSDDISSKFSANNLIKIAVANIGGNGGGGQNNFAMGGGNDAKSIDVAINKIKEEITNVG